MIKIGNTVYIEVSNDPSTNEKTTYRSKLMDSIDGYFVVDTPVHKETGKSGIFMLGTEVDVWFVGADDAVYSFSSEITHRQRGKINRFYLKNPGKDHYTRIQRRNYLRIDAAVDVAVHSKTESFDPFVTTTIDIGGGGIYIVLPEQIELKKEEMVDVWLVLHLQDGVIHYVKTRSKVVRVENKEKGFPNRCSMQFIHIDENDRQKIISYCFQQQILRR